MMWYPIHAINLNLLQVKSRTDLFLRLEIIKKIIGLAILVIRSDYLLYKRNNIFNGIIDY